MLREVPGHLLLRHSSVFWVSTIPLDQFKSTIKKQTIAFDEIEEEDFSIKNADESKSKKTEFHWKNIMPIPHFLNLSLEKFDPRSVAEAFYIAMKEFDILSKTTTGAPNLINEESLKIQRKMRHLEKKKLQRKMKFQLQ